MDMDIGIVPEFVSTKRERKKNIWLWEKVFLVGKTSEAVRLA
jgi:hypothetical protein